MAGFGLIPRMFSSLAKGLAGGLQGANDYMNDVFYNAAMSQRFGPNWRELRDEELRQAKLQTQADEIDLNTRKLANEARTLENEKTDADLFLASGGMKRGETTPARTTYAPAADPERRIQFEGTDDELMASLRAGGRSELTPGPGQKRAPGLYLRDAPETRFERIANIQGTAAAMEEIEARRKMRAEEALATEDRRLEQEADQRKEALETAREEREVERHPLEQRKRELDIARAEQELADARAKREAGLVEGPVDERRKVPAGFFDEMVLTEARRLAPEVEADLEASFEDSLDEARAVELTDYPPEVIQEALANVEEKKTFGPAGRSLGREDSQLESRVRAKINEGRESELTPEEVEYIRSLGRSRRR